MRRSLQHITLALLIGVLVALTSCTHKDLYVRIQRTSELRVVFDWKHAPEARPATMVVLFYPLAGGAPIVHEIPSQYQGIVEVPFGNYKIICYNGDTEAVLFRYTDSPDRVEAFTRSEPIRVRQVGIPQLKELGDQRSVLRPDRLWSDRVETFTVLEVPNKEGITYKQMIGDRYEQDPTTKTHFDQTITLYPRAAYVKFTVTITGVDNLKHISDITATLSGMAAGYNLGKGERTDEEVLVPFDPEKVEPNILTGSFETFGPVVSANGKHYLTVFVILSDGSKFYYTYDVTDQVKNAPDPTHIHIHLNKLPLPDPIAGGSGMDVNVDDWEEINIDLVF